MMFAAVFSTVLTLADAVMWFDGGIDRLESWPSDGSDVTITGQGVWTGTENASLAESRLTVDSTESGSTLEFNPAVQKSLAENNLAYEVKSRFQVSEKNPDVDASLKCAFAACVFDDVTNYYGWVGSAAGDTNRWVLLSGATPVDDEITLRIYLRMSDGQRQVKFTVDDTVLSSDGEEWLPAAGTGEPEGTVCFAGTGSVSSLTAQVEPLVQVERKTLTIPAIDNVVVAHVRVAGAEVEAEEDGTYSLEKGSVVTVTFAPAAGYALDVLTMTFVVSDDMELPEIGRPTATDVQAAITINEIMAKNSDTLKTKNGYEGLDWVELANHSDEDVDLTGWYFYNNPTAKTSKWTVIKGSCIVPAHGYKIVWCDKDGVCPDDGFAADEAYVRFNITTDSNSGKVLFLANQAGEIFNRLTLPGGIKDVSYGLGHLSRTVVSTTAEAQYRVGDGEWQTVKGSVGMSSAVGRFRTVEYKSKKTLSTMDVVETCLADSTTWSSAPVTNTVDYLAFGSGGSFDSSIYSNFPAYNADDTILVASGTVLIPRSGDWSFAVGSDDGFTARLTRLGTNWSWESRGTRSYAQSVAQFNLEAGAYAVEVVYYNRNGGRVLDFSAAEGRLDFSTNDFTVVGTSACPVTHTGALGAQIAAEVTDEMLGKTTSLAWKTTFDMAEAPADGDSFRLLMRYTDGFTAKLNGETVLTVPAPGTRTADEALQAEAFTLPGSAVVDGENTLEIIAENNDIDDTELLIAPELRWDIGEQVFVYSTTPTPGAENAADGKTGFTPKVEFSEPHGYKESAFELTLSCPDNPYAVIYYTLDGSSPVIGNTSTCRYETPIAISKTTVVRAAVPDADSILQQDTSATYLFIEEILAADSTAPYLFPTNKQINSQAMRYGMDTAITQSADEDTQARLRRGFTNGVRTVSLVIDPRHLFDQSSGIYVNASGNGRDWERPLQVEQINPTDASDEFNVPAGIRIRGAYSRGSGYPKHSFRLFFRSEYGMGTLKHAMFGDEGADEFEKIDFRTEQNYSWANGGSWETFVHEVFARDSQRDMGESYNRSRYYHLFINGVYWGLYQTEERVSQSYAESYNGGTEDSYDVVRTSTPGYNTGVVEGESEAWENLWRITTQQGYGENYPNNYNRVRGLDADGNRDSTLPVYLNETNLITYLITSQFAADSDSPANWNGMANNLAAYRNRVDDSGKANGFIWNRHDAEHSLSRGGSYSSGTNTLLYGTRGLNHSTAIGNFNPAELHYELCSNAVYRQTFADLVYRHVLQTGGAMTPAKAEARFRARMAEIDDAIVVESARWGSSTKTRATWLSNCNDCLTFINRRAPYLIAAYRALGWYPNVDAVDAVTADGTGLVDGDTVAADEQLYLSVPYGAVAYYTTDGSDPRTSATAVEYTGTSPIPVTVPVISKGDEWKYYDAGQLPADNWTAADYDDSAWSEGPSRLGFASSGTFGTTIAKYVGGGTSGTQVTTFYFRKTFTLPDNAASITNLQASLDCDDGYILYLNGVEVARDQVASAEYDAFSTATNMGEKDATFTFEPGTLKAGENVIAVEVHQCNATSSDAWWNLGLTYEITGGTESGLSVPAEGLTLNVAAVKDGEWSAMASVTLQGEGEVGPAEIEISPSAPVEVEAADAAAAAAAVTILVPEECEPAGVADATYRALFDVTATAVEGREGAYSVALSLKAEVVDEVQPKLDAAAKAIVGSLEEILGDGQVAVETRAGLFYRIDTAAELSAGASWTKGSPVMGTGAQLPVPLATPEGLRAFFRVIASPVK